MAPVEICVGISCRCMPTAASFFKDKSSICKGWSVSASNLMRGLLRYGKHSNASKDFEGSWQSINSHANGRIHYVDLEMEGNKTNDLTYGKHQQQTPFE